MKLGARELLFFCVMLGLLGSSYYFVFSRVNLKRQQHMADIRDKTKSLENLRRAEAGIDDLTAKIGDLQKAIDFFESKLPQEKEFDKILKEVTQLADANSLTTKTVRSLKSERFAGYSEQPIQMTMTGNFNGFYSFLLQLEKLPRITRVLHMSMTKVPEHDGEMQAQLTMSIFFAPESARASAGD
jgi:type IV pilus assembly protein PilO